MDPKGGRHCCQGGGDGSIMLTHCGAVNITDELTCSNDAFAFIPVFASSMYVGSWPKPSNTIHPSSGFVTSRALLFMLCFDCLLRVKMLILASDSDITASTVNASQAD